MYLNGDGVVQEHDKVVRWLRKAAAQGKGNAQSALGVAYLNGAGVAQDNEKAVWWLRKAAIQGNAIAQYSLGNVYFFPDLAPLCRRLFQ
jgi:TPR repeat protein